MPKRELYFAIEGTTPHVLPMVRLAAYLKDLAVVLGSENSVHFIKVSEGSAACVLEIDEEETASVLSRAQGVPTGNAPKEAVTAYESLQKSLQSDELSADLKMETGETLLQFPLVSEKLVETFGPFWQEGTLDGMLVKVGGLDDTVPVHLLDVGTHHVCNATREIARELAPHLFGNPIRVHGKGRWVRNPQGQWEMGWFDISSFEDLDDKNIFEVVSRLRSIPDNELMTLKDPLEEMRKIRHGDE